MKHYRPRLQTGEVWPGRVLRLAEADGAIVEIETPDGAVTVRVPGAVPGDELFVRIGHVGQHMAWGKIERVDVAAVDRVDAPCPVVLRCGGCPWQMVELSAQYRIKQADLQERLGPLAAQTVWREWQPHARATGYRTRALMMTRRVHGRLLLGFFAAGTDDLVAVDQCIVQHPKVERVLHQVREVLDQSGITTWRDAQRPGQLRAVLFRLDPRQQDGLLTLVVSHEVGLPSIAAQLLEIPGVSGVFANIQPAAGGAVLGAETRHLVGATMQTVQLAQTQLQIGATAFLQTRHDAAEAIVRTLQGYLPGKIAHLVDLYAGVGVFGLALRDRCERVTLVERDPAAVADAEANLASLDAPHVKAVRESAEEFAPQLAALHPDAIVLDPPRAGCAPVVLAALADVPASTHLVYVSCNGVSLARDLAVLATQGWQVNEIAPIDMFPHTPHAEWVVHLTRVAVAEVAAPVVTEAKAKVPKPRKKPVAAA
jgi:23S rRNA (uracil1939-C5)-methyltransferase